MKTLSHTKLVLSALAVLAVSTSACNLEEIRDKRAREKAKTSAEINRDVQENLEKQAVEKAKKDLKDRIRYIKAIAGEYEADLELPTSPSQPVTRKVRVTLQVTPLNIPAPWSYDHPETAAQVLAQMDSLTLSLDVTEKVEGVNWSIYCFSESVRPDYRRGTLRFTCSGVTGGGTRTYFLSLDDDTLPYVMNGAVRAEAVSLNLIEGAMTRVDLIGVRIRSSVGLEITGYLPRTQAGDDF